MIEYDYYKILGIQRLADLNEVKAAYRNMAKLYHPDINNSEKANEYFAVINDAYETLSDEKKRYIYDIKLNYVDSVQKEVDRKKHYYGNSIKATNFHYDWESISKAYRPKTDEDYFKESPIFYNALFVCGMFLGFIIAIVSIVGSFNNYWPFPFILVCIPGLILIRGGWKGIMGKKTLLNNFLKLLGK